MTKIVSAIMLTLAMTAPPALARATNPNVAIPSAQNSGVGIGGFAGTEAGPAVQPGTVGAAAVTGRYNMSVAEQDPSGIPALPGTEAGRSVKAPSHLG